MTHAWLVIAHAEIDIWKWLACILENTPADII